MYEKFLNCFTDYIFVKDEPQKADVIFVPGNGYPQMAVHAADSGKKDLRRLCFRREDTVL